MSAEPAGPIDADGQRGRVLHLVPTEQAGSLEAPERLDTPPATTTTMVTPARPVPAVPGAATATVTAARPTMAPAPEDVVPPPPAEPRTAVTTVLATPARPAPAGTTTPADTAPPAGTAVAPTAPLGAAPPVGPPADVPADVLGAGEAVRAVWAHVAPAEEELARWFGALLFSLAPPLRSLFPAQAGPEARRLLRATVAAMAVVDRPGALPDAVAALAREHRALGLDDAAGEPVGVALVGAVREFAGGRWTPDTDAAWARAYSLAVEPARRAAASLPGVVEATVVGHRRLSWDVAVIVVAPDDTVAYRAGQSVSVEIPQRPRMWRRLTPAGAPRADGLLEFHVRAVEGGWVSRCLVAHAECGDRWRLGPAEGGSELDPTAERELLLAVGGTGASVALALCEDLAARAAEGAAVRPTTVVVGARTREDLHTLGRFGDLARDAPWLRVVAACESDPLDTSLAPGTVVDAVARSGPWRDHDVVIAGSPAMTRATVAALLVDGTPLDRIHYDAFTDADDDGQA